MKNQSDILAGVLRKHEQEVHEAINQTPDWPRAVSRFDIIFSHMVNPKDSLWSSAMVEKLTAVYLAGRGDYQSNITLRTVSAMPAALRNDTKKDIHSDRGSLRSFQCFTQAKLRCERTS